jgi:hypothetical protein
MPKAHYGPNWADAGLHAWRRTGSGRERTKMSGQLSWPGDSKDVVTVSERPKHVMAAVILMYVGAVLAMPGLIKVLWFTPRSELEANARESLKRTKQSVTPAHIDSWISNLTMLAIVTTVVSVVLWIVMAQLTVRGKRWARSIATVLAAGNVFMTMLNILAGAAPSVVEWLSVLVGLTAVILLWTPLSRQWFASQNQRV